MHIPLSTPFATPDAILVAIFVTCVETGVICGWTAGTCDWTGGKAPARVSSAVTGWSCAVIAGSSGGIAGSWAAVTGSSATIDRGHGRSGALTAHPGSETAGCSKHNGRPAWVARLPPPFFPAAVTRACPALPGSPVPR